MSRPAKERPPGFGRYLWEQRLRSNYSAKALATLAGVAASGVTDLELGKRKLTPRMAHKLAGPLGLTMNSLLLAAGLTPELDWARAYAPPDQAQPNALILSPAERALVDAFVDFIRFHRNTAGIYPRLR